MQHVKEKAKERNRN